MTVPIRPGPSPADQIEMDRATAERGSVEVVRVALGERAYDIVIRRGLLASLEIGRAHV